MAHVHQGHGNFYAYSAVCPATEEDVIPFLGELGKVLGGRTDVPENIEIVPLPPYSPEPDPVERLWAWLKRHALRNRLKHTLDEVMDSLEDAMRRATPDFLKNICRCNYLSH